MLTDTLLEIPEPEFDYLPAPAQSTAMPHSVEAEEAVIGSVFIDPEQINELFDILQPMDFYIHRHQWIWGAMVELFCEAQPIDLLTVADLLEKKGQLQEIGGRSCLTALVNQVPSSLNAESYARIVEGHSIRRKMIQKANDTATLAYDTGKKIDDVIKDVDALWEDKPAPSRTTLITALDAADQLEERIDAGKPTAVGMGLSIPDNDFGGFPIQAITMFVADYSTGKTALMLQACEQLDFSGGRPLYVTLEEPAWKMVGRWVFPNSQVSRVDFRTASLTAGQKSLLKDEIKKYKAKHPRLAFDQQARTVQGIRRSIRQHRAKLCIVDDLLHVQTDKTQRGENDTMALIRTVTQLKDIAIDENCAIVLIHHLSNEDSAKFQQTGQKKPTANVPPSITNIPWATTLRFTIDMWLAIVPDYQANVSADVVEMILWVLKDKESARMKSEIHLWYDKLSQWWYDRNSKHLMTTTPVVSQMPLGSNKP